MKHIKKIKYLMITIIVISSFIGVCFLINSYKKIYNKKFKIAESQIIEPIDGISMTIKDGTLTKSGATIIIKDTIKDEEHVYGKTYRIEKEKNGKWYAMNTKINHGSSLMGYLVNEDDILEMEINWEFLYGKLRKGRYRVITDFDVSKNDIYLGSKDIYVEFSIK